MSISASVGVLSTGNFAYGGNLVLNRLPREDTRDIDSLVCRHTDVYRRHFNTKLFTEGYEGKRKERQQPRQSSSQKKSWTHFVSFTRQCELVPGRYKS